MLSGKIGARFQGLSIFSEFKSELLLWCALRGLFVILCLALPLGLLVLHWDRCPWDSFMDRDADIYATIAFSWDQGLLPYRDVYDFKPPSTYLLYRLAFSLWGYSPKSLWHLHIIVMGVLTILSCATGYFTRSYALVIVFPMACILLFVMGQGGLLDCMTNTEVFVGWFVLAGFLVGELARSPFTKHRAWTFLAGALIGAAFMAKQPGIFFLLVPVCQLVIRQRFELLRIISDIAILSFGAVVPLALWSCYFLYHGALDSFLLAVFRDGYLYAGSSVDTLFNRVSRGVSSLGTLELLSLNKGLWPYLFPLVMAPLLLLFRATRGAMLVMVGALVAGNAAWAVGPGDYGHYKVFHFSTVVIILTLFWEQVRLLWADPSILKNKCQEIQDSLGISIVFTALVLGPVFVQVLELLKSPPRLPADPSELQKIGEFIQGMSRPESRLAIWDMPFSSYVYAETLPVWRFIYGDAPAPQFEKDRDFARVKAEVPEFFLVATAADRDQDNVNLTEGISLGSFLERHYDVVAVYSSAKVYRRRENQLLSFVSRKVVNTSRDPL